MDGRLQALLKIRWATLYYNGYCWLWSLSSRSHLLQSQRSTSDRLVHTQQSLHHYQGFGEAFSCLAQEYQELLLEVENKQWALTELSKTEHDFPS